MENREDKLINAVNEIFESFAQDQTEIEKKAIKTTNTNSDKEFKRAVKYGKQELDKLYEAFVTFTQEIKGLKIKDYIQKDIIQLGSKCEFLEHLIKGKIKDVKDPNAAKNLEKTRAQILADLFNYYEKDMPF